MSENFRKLNIQIMLDAILEMPPFGSANGPHVARRIRWANKSSTALSRRGGTSWAHLLCYGPLKPYRPTSDVMIYDTCVKLEIQYKEKVRKEMPFYLIPAELKEIHIFLRLGVPEIQSKSICDYFKPRMIQNNDTVQRHSPQIPVRERTHNPTI